jgi:ABC-type branched-subunit amino acid transport system ATPase component
MSKKYYRFFGGLLTAQEHWLNKMSEKGYRLIRAEKRNKGILLTDHMYRHVTDVADRLYVLANGQTYLTQGDEDLVRYGYLNHL